jgi:hypothetical protein
VIALRSSAWIAAAVAVAFAAVVALRPSAPAQHVADVAAAVDARDAVETDARTSAALDRELRERDASERLSKLRSERDRLDREIREYQREHQNDMLIDPPRRDPTR